jgi:hypothetical protein
MHWNRLYIHLWKLLAAVWLVTACTDPENKAPNDLIPEDRMADVLTEVHMTEVQVSRLGLRSTDSSNIVYKHLENQIFKKFKIDTAAYRKSYIFYSSHPQQMEIIYKRVTEQLKKKQEAKQPPTRS